MTQVRLAGPAPTRHRGGHGAAMVAGALAVALSAGAVHAADPKLPPGTDPGLRAIALLTTGLDYTDPKIAARLARDGEGELTGWDFVDNDRRPFAKADASAPAAFGGNGTAIALDMIAADAGISIMPVRIDPGDPLSFGRAAAFVARTPATVVAVPAAGGTQSEWAAFAAAAAHFTQVEFLVPVCGLGKDGQPDSYPAAVALPNVRRITAAMAKPGTLDEAILVPCKLLAVPDPLP